MKYLSPSSIGDWIHCQEYFKLRRVDGQWPPRGFIMSRETGTTFDAYVKRLINKRIDPAVLLSEFSAQNVDHAQALMYGKSLSEDYEKSGALQHLIDEGVASVNLDIEKEVNGVPVFGRIDGFMNDGTILDFKVSGVGKGASPKPGYYRCIKWAGYVEKVMQHDKSDEFLETIDETWALQTCIYTFLMGRKPFPGMKCRIEMVAVRENYKQFASYCNPISLSFQEYVWDLIPRVWDAVQDQIFPLPTYDKRKCNLWGRPCDVADKCEAYKRKDEESII